jgi:hypothetical protein
MLPWGAEKEMLPPLPVVPERELENEFESELLRKILPMSVFMEMSPPFPVFPVVLDTDDRDAKAESVRDMSPLWVFTEIAPPFPALPRDVENESEEELEAAGSNLLCVEQVYQFHVHLRKKQSENYATNCRDSETH